MSTTAPTPRATSAREKPAGRKTRGLAKKVDEFRRWAFDLTLDTGDPWDLEPFQIDIVRDYLAGFAEVWTVIPEGNAKTTLVAGIALHHGDHVPSPMVPIGASSREQAEIMYRQAEGFVLRTPGMQERFKCQEGYRRIKCLATAGRIQVFAADAGTADGVIPTLAILDELHRHRDLRLYRTWRGKILKRGGQVVAISTAGEPSSEFEETRTHILRTAEKTETKGARIRAIAGGLVLHDFAVRDRAKVDDMRAVKAANPLSTITVADLRDKRGSASMSGSQQADAHWMRFVCNIPSRESGQAITAEAWDALAEEGLDPDHSAWTIGWLDLGWEIDTTAVGVLVWESFERRVLPKPVVLEPPVDEADIVGALLDFQERYGVTGWVYDKAAGGQQMAQLLDKGEHPLQQGRDAGPITFIEHNQGNALMCEAAARFDEAVRQRYLVHDGDPILRAHILNAVRRTVSGERFRYDRPPDAKGERRRKFPIDALTGASMGHSVAVAQHASANAGADFGDDDLPAEDPYADIFDGAEA